MSRGLGDVYKRQPIISAVVDVILTVVDGLLTGIETVFNFLAPYISQIWGSICGFFDSASSTITTSNITSSNYKESITNMVNKVRIYDGEGKPQGVVQNDADVKKYGIFQQTYTKEEGKDATTTAKSMFKTVEKTFTLECVNLNEAVTGAGAVVRDSSTGLSGVVWIDADTHTWQNGVATMSLTVTLKQMMDTKEG